MVFLLKWYRALQTGWEIAPEIFYIEENIMDIGKAFTYPFEDERWFSKSLVGALVWAIPIVNFAWGGYMIDVLKNVVAGNPRPLPEWGDFGEKWVKGGLLVVAGLIYAIPVFVLACIPLTLFGGMAAFQGQGNNNLFDTAGGLLTGVGGLFACLIAIYSLALSFYYPAIYIHFARLGEFRAFFEFSHITKIISADLGKYLTAWVITLLAGIFVGLFGGVVSSILGFIPCIGWILGWVVTAIVGVYLFYIYAHIFAQVVMPASAMTVPPAQ
jgi:Protein of unknown function (DUF4013)